MNVLEWKIFVLQGDAVGEKGVGASNGSEWETRVCAAIMTEHTIRGWGIILAVVGNKSQAWTSISIASV